LTPHKAPSQWLEAFYERHCEHYNNDALACFISIYRDIIADIEGTSSPALSELNVTFLLFFLRNYLTYHLYQHDRKELEHQLPRRWRQAFVAYKKSKGLPGHRAHVLLLFMAAHIYEDLPLALALTLSYVTNAEFVRIIDSISAALKKSTCIDQDGDVIGKLCVIYLRYAGPFVPDVLRVEHGIQTMRNKAWQDAQRLNPFMPPAATAAVGP
jgi:hypothetical protein